ncbi:MAG: sigma factor-like helix-turn-helix DNA-binding protein [Faecousia sp.]
MIEKAWEVLSEREADILRLRELRVTLSEIAAKYGISNDRVR